MPLPNLLCFSMVYNACAVLCSWFPLLSDVIGSYVGSYAL